MNRRKLIVLLLITVALTVGTASAAPFGRLDLRFDTSRWKSMLTPVTSSKGHGVYAQDGQLICEAGALMRTPFMECAGSKSSSITINIQAKTNGIRASKDNQGAIVMICGYNANHSRCIEHRTIAIIAGTGNWQHYTKTVSFSPSVAYVAAKLGNSGEAGTASFKDLHIEQSLSDAQQLIDDPGFEATLGQDTWFLNSRGKDVDGLELNPSGNTPGVDSIVFIQGTRSLAINGPATVQSRELIYNGEVLWLGGWLKTENVVRGKKKWMSAGVQISGRDRDGREVAHYDLQLMSGTHGWQYYTKKVQFSAAVKKVVVLVRVFATAKGQFWVDDVSLLREPLKGTRTPFNAAKATVSINATEPAAQLINPVWASTDAKYTAQILDRPYVDDAMQRLKDAGFIYLRCREIMWGTNFYMRDDAQGNPIYNWKRFDRLFDLIVKKYGFIPMPTIGTTPQALHRPGDKVTHQNSNPPTNYAKWSRSVRDMLNHCIDRYGADTVRKWVWEFWNEPGAKPAGMTLFEPVHPNGPTAFELMFKGALEAVAEVEKQHHIRLTMSMTSGGMGAGSDAVLLRYLSRQAPELIRYISGFSYHRYAGGNSPIQLLIEPVADKESLRMQYKMADAKGLWCTEWNMNSMSSPLMDQPFDAAGAIVGTRLFLDHNVSVATFFTMTDYPWVKPTTPIFNGGLGMMTRNAIPKAVYNSFVFMNRLRDGHRLKLTSSNRPIDGLAVAASDGTVRIVLSSFDEDVTRIGYQTQVTVRVHASQPLKAARYWYVDQTHGNAFEAWKQMGQPAATDLEARKKLIEASRYATGTPPNAAWNPKEQTCEIELTMPSLSVAYLELTPDNH